MKETYRLLIFDWEGTLVMPQNRQLYPGTKETLLTLQKHYTLAVATNHPRCSFNILLEKTALKEVFTTTVCADETAFKPDPMMLYQILAELDLKPTQALMIGDTIMDMEMAKNAGVAGIPLLYDQRDKHQFKAYKPKLLLNNITELLTLHF